MSAGFAYERAQAHEQATLLDSCHISSEDILVASEVSAAMVEKFGFDANDVRTIPVISEENQPAKAVVVYTGPGLAKGSYDDICLPERRDEFDVSFGGVVVGTREGMDFPTYQAMYKALYTEAQAMGKLCMTDHLPKDDPLYQERTWTWLTAYQPVDGYASIGTVRYAGDVTEPDTRPSSGDFDAVRFRPAVAITRLLVNTFLANNPVA